MRIVIENGNKIYIIVPLGLRYLKYSSILNNLLGI